MRLNLIYLAAGNSRRFGENKLLFQIQGKPLYRYGLERLMEICERYPQWKLTVVTQYEEIYREVRRLPVWAVFSPKSRQGISHSIRAGILEGSGEEGKGGFVFFVADQPWMSSETLEGFLKAMEEKKPLLGCISYRGCAGNPVYFSESMREELLALRGEQGGRTILKGKEAQTFFYEAASERELEDLDYRPEETLAFLR